MLTPFFASDPNHLKLYEHYWLLDSLADNSQIGDSSDMPDSQSSHNLLLTALFPYL